MIRLIKLHNLRNKPHNNIPTNAITLDSMIRSLMCCLLLCCLLMPQMLFAARENERGRHNGIVASVSIGAEYMSHKAGNGRVSGVMMSANPSLGWNLWDYAKIEAFGSFGGTPTEINGVYPYGANELVTLNLTRGTFTRPYLLGTKAGYNVSSIFKYWQHSIFINVGFDKGRDNFTGIGFPYEVTKDSTRLFIELEGRARINQKYAIEYALRVSNLKENITFVSGMSALIAYGYGIKASAGFQYRLSEWICFFARLVGEYSNMNTTSSSINLTTGQNPQSSALKPNASVVVAYPATTYIGVQWGFGF